MEGAMVDEVKEMKCDQIFHNIFQVDSDAYFLQYLYL